MSHREVTAWAADLVGLSLDEAEERAWAAGTATSRVLTGPPWPGEGTGAARVVRVRQIAPGKLELTVAREGHSRVPGDGRAGGERSE